MCYKGVYLLNDAAGTMTVYKILAYIILAGNLSLFCPVELGCEKIMMSLLLLCLICDFSS